MIILVSMLIGFFALVFGFLLGLAFGKKPKIIKKVVKENAEVLKEYENFLNYDGSVQQ